MNISANQSHFVTYKDRVEMYLEFPQKCFDIKIQSLQRVFRHFRSHFGSLGTDEHLRLSTLSRLPVCHKFVNFNLHYASRMCQSNASLLGCAAHDVSCGCSHRCRFVQATSHVLVLLSTYTAPLSVCLVSLSVAVAGPVVFAGFCCCSFFVACPSSLLCHLTPTR